MKIPPSEPIFSLSIFSRFLLPETRESKKRGGKTFVKNPLSQLKFRLPEVSRGKNETVVEIWADKWEIGVCTLEIKFGGGGERWTKVIVDDRGITIRVMRARGSNGARLENVIGTAPSIINW